MIIIIIIFIIVFGILVFVYEFGYYYFVKWVGILVCEFLIGMGFKVWWWCLNGMIYIIWILLFGGYVCLVGVDEDEDEFCFGMLVIL